MSQSDPITVLSTDDCWERLRGQEFGRLAYHLTDEVHIVPINYAVDEGRILFRTAEGSKLLGVVMDTDVAFEIDLVDEEAEVAWSVVARGRASVLEGDPARQADNLRLRPWIDTEKFNIVAVEVDELSGRQFRMSRPWRQMIPHDQG